MLRILKSTWPAFLLGGIAGASLSTVTSPMAALVIVVASTATLALLARSVGTTETSVLWVATASAIGALHTLPPSPRPVPHIDEPMCGLAGRIEHRIESRFGSRLIVEKARVRALTGNGSFHPVGRVIVSASETLPARLDRYVQVRARGRLRSTAKDTLHFDAVTVSCTSASAFTLSHSLRGRVDGRITERLPHRPVGSLARALLTGRRLDADTSALLRGAGVLHLFVVSGLHLAFVALVLTRVPPFRGQRTGAGVFIPVLIVTGYAAFTGLRPPVLRAVLAVWLMALARSHRRSVDGGWIVLVVGGLQLAVAPEMARDPSFLLSLSAVAGIAYLARPWRPQRRMDPLDDFLARKIGNGPGDTLRSALVVSWAATMTTAPISLALFGRTAVASVLTSPLIAPFAAVFALTTLTALADGRIAGVPDALGRLILAIAARTPLEVEAQPTPLSLAIHLMLLTTAAILAHGERLSLRMRRAVTIALPALGLVISTHG